MPGYTQPHRCYCGIDLQARSMPLGILDHDGTVVLDQNLAARPETFLRALAPFQDDLVGGAEGMDAGDGLADRCAPEQIACVLGHARYRKLMYGTKTKNDRSDAGTIVRWLRGGHFPRAYVYPRGRRAPRDRRRRRTYLVRPRAAWFTHLQILNGPYHRPPFPPKLAFAANRLARDIAQRFRDPSGPPRAAGDRAVSDTLDAQIAAVELHRTRTATVDDGQMDHRLQTIPGVGKVLALVLLSAIHDSRRFADEGQFRAYARRVRCAHESAGKQRGTGNRKLGNAPLRGAFAEAAGRFLRRRARARKWQEKQAKKRGQARVLALLAARRARAVSPRWRQGAACDQERCGPGPAAAGPAASV